MLMRLNLISRNVSVSSAEESVAAPTARVWRVLSSTVVHVSESSHLHEGFGPDSGAHGQDSAGSSLQEANVTLQLPALHQRAGLQGGQTHTSSVWNSQWLNQMRSSGLTGAEVFRHVTIWKLKWHKGVWFPSSLQPSAASALINDFRPTHLNIEAHLAHAKSFLKLSINAVAIFGAAVSTSFWCSSPHPLSSGFTWWLSHRT